MADLDLSVWESDECTLTSDERSPTGSLTISQLGEDSACGQQTGQLSDQLSDQLLHRLAGRHDDFLSTVKSRYRFSCLTELHETEYLSEPEIIRATASRPVWPCDLVKERWFKIRVYIARRFRLPCCQELTWPQEWARRRPFEISKKHYMSLPDLEATETEAIIRWSALVTSEEWRQGNWNDLGILKLEDSRFLTAKVTWSVMEDHLATLAYSGKKPLVFLATRLCMESIAKNKAMYTSSQMYWAFARICTHLLQSGYAEVREGMLLSLQLYLRTLKVFHSCFSHKCREYASAGLFPVLLDMLTSCPPHTQAVVLNILVLMGMHAPYLSLVANMGSLSTLVKMADTSHELLQKRVHSCLEVLSKHVPVQHTLVEEGILPLAVQHFSLMYPTCVQLNCLFIINSLCTNRKNLFQILAVDNSSVLDSVMRVLSEWTSLFTLTLSNRGQHGVSVTQIQNWCTLPRQNLILLCKLCVDVTACEQMVKRGLVLKLKGVWYTCHVGTDRALVIEALAIMARFNGPAEKLCYEGFLTCLVEGFCDDEHREQILEVVFNLGKKHLSQMFDAGLIQKVVFSLGEKNFDRKLLPAVMSILASFSANDQVRDLLLENEGQAYTLVLDTAFLTSDVSLLQSCNSVISKMNTSVVSCQLLESNMLLLVAYIDKLLKTGPDGLALHGLMQLQDYLKVPFLLKAFLEHHVPRVVEVLCWPPYTAPVHYLARQVLELLTGASGRRASATDQMFHDVTKQTSDDSQEDRIKEL